MKGPAPPVFYYYDGNSTNANELDFSDDSQFYFFVYGEEEDTSSNRMEVHVFSDSMKYINYVSQNGMEDMLVYEEIVRHLADHAEETEVMAEAEQLEAIPDWWTDYEKNYTTSTLAAEGIEYQTGLANYIRKRCYSGPGMFMPNTTGVPWLGLFGYKNEVESFIPYALYSVHKNYQKAFYRDRNWTMWVWGYQNIPLCEYPYPINFMLMNKGNSWWWFGI